MTDLAKLVVKLEAQSAQLTKELQSATSKINAFEKNVTSSVRRAASNFAAGFAGAFSVTQLLQFTKATIDAADEVARVSQIVGLSAESFSALQYAAQQAGVDSAALQTSLTKLSKTVVDAADGSGAAADAFRAIGVAVKDGSGQLKANDVLLEEVAQSFARYADGATKTAAAQAIFGKSGAELIPLLNEGKDGIEALKDEAARLGLVISSEAAASADQFNDTLDRLKGAVRGSAQTVLADLLPSLNGIAELAAESATQSGALKQVMEGLGVAFKIVASGGVILGNAFQLIGKQVGGTAAMIVAAVQGDFSRVGQIYKDLAADQEQDVRDIGEGLAAIWEGTSVSVEKSSKRGAAGIKQLDFSLPTAGAKRAAEAVEIFAASLDSAKLIAEEADKIFGPLLADAARTFEATRTPLEQFNAELERLNRLRDNFVDGKPLIDAQTYTRAVAQAQDQLDQVGRGIEKVGKTTQDTTDSMSTYADQAARNMQDAFADFLFDPFDKGLKGLLSSFADTLQRMAAQAAAAQIFESFGSLASGGILDGLLGAGGGSGISSPVFDIPISGARAAGGSVMAGNSYLVGEKGPELFTADTSGSITPNHELGSGMAVTNNFVIQAPQGMVSKQTQLQIAASAARGLRTADRRNN